MNQIPILSLVAGMALLALSAARPSILVAPSAGIRFQVVARGGDSAGTIRLRSDSSFAIGGLNDRGQITVVAESAPTGEVLLQCQDGKLFPIAVGGGAAPGGTWSTEEDAFLGPVSQDREGNAVFAASRLVAGKGALGTFRWDGGTRQVQAI